MTRSTLVSSHGIDIILASLTTFDAAALTIFGVAHRFDDGFTYSQAYWITFASTIASLTVTVTLLIDYFRTSDFSKSGSGLTRKQRSLVIIVMILLAYLGFGALVYCYMIHLTFLDALYFAVCSGLTIGFGDITPTTTASQVFSVFYNTFGILNTGLAIAIARETIVESFEQSYRSRRHALAMRRRLHRQAHATHHHAKHGLWLTGHKFNSNAPSQMELPISSSPPTPFPEISSATDPDVALGKDEKENGTRDEVNQTGTDTNGRPVPWRQRSGMSTFSTRSESIPIAEALEDQDATDIVQDKTGETKDQAKTAGFDHEERDYIQFRQDMIREERKEFKAKVCVCCCH